jgi:hypothetical protein
MASEPRTDPQPTAATAAPAKPAVDGRAPSERMPVDRVVHPDLHAPVVRADLTDTERRLLGDLFAIVEEHSEDAAVTIERPRVEDAFLFACEHHADQRRKSGEDFIVHPVGVAKICAGMRLDTETLCAALLHDTVEDTSASLDEVRERFGDEVATLVDGVTKLTGITFTSRDEASTRSSGSSRTSPSPRCTRASTRRSRAWSTSSARSARSTCSARARSSRASSTRWASTPRSRGARSTSTRSTRR